jgi:hypothetical protein
VSEHDRCVLQECADLVEEAVAFPAKISNDQSVQPRRWCEIREHDNAGDRGIRLDSSDLPSHEFNLGIIF